MPRFSKTNALAFVARTPGLALNPLWRVYCEPWSAEPTALSAVAGVRTAAAIKQVRYAPTLLHLLKSFVTPEPAWIDQTAGSYNFQYGNKEP